MEENKEKLIMHQEEEKPLFEFPALVKGCILFASFLLGLSLLLLPWHFVLFIFIGLCSAVAVFFNIFIGLLLFLVIATLHPGKLISEAYGLYYLSRYLSFGVLFIWLFHTLVYRDFKVVKARQNIALLGFAIVIFLSCVKDRGLLTLLEGGYTTEYLLDYIKLFILYFLIIYLIKTRKQFMIFIWSLIILGTVSCFIGLYQYANGIGMIEEGGSLRITGTAADPNYYALHIIMLIPISISLLLNSRSILTKLFLSGFTILSLLNVLFTFSRGGMIGLAIVLSLSFVIMLLHNRNKIIPSLIVVLIVISAIPFIPEQYWSRAKTITNLEDVAVRARLDTWKIGYEMVQDHPVLGVGVGNFPYEYYYRAMTSRDTKTKARHVAHNTFIEVAAESGIIALVFFIMLILWTMGDLRKSGAVFRKSGDNQLYYISQALIISLMGYIACGVFLSQQYLFMFWIIVPLSIVIRRLET